MTGRVIFLLEEPSMKAFLLEFLPRLIPRWQHEIDFLLIPHQGKSDLDKSIPKKLQAWREPGVRFVIVRDNDGADCLALKQRLQQMCVLSGHPVLIRLICQELESWYLADVDALKTAYPNDEKAIIRLTKRFPDPDTCLKPSHELERSLTDFQKQDAARRLGKLLSTQQMRSRSFHVFTTGVAQLALA